MSKYIGTARINEEIKILNYSKSKNFDLIVEDDTEIVHSGPTKINPKIVSKTINCKNVKKIVVETPEMDIYSAEKFVEEKAQSIADYISFCMNKKVTIELDSIQQIDGKKRNEYSEGYDHTEEHLGHIPQIIDLSKVEELDEDTVSQLSNYNYGLEHNNITRLKGNYKVIEIENPNEKILTKNKIARDLEAHGKLDRKESVESAKQLLGRVSLRPTYLPDREKIGKYARALQNYASGLLHQKIKNKWTGVEEIPEFKSEKGTLADIWSILQVVTIFVFLYVAVIFLEKSGADIINVLSATLFPELNVLFFAVVPLVFITIFTVLWLEKFEVAKEKVVKSINKIFHESESNSTFLFIFLWYIIGTIPIQVLAISGFESIGERGAFYGPIIIYALFFIYRYFSKKQDLHKAQLVEGTILSVAIIGYLTAIFVGNVSVKTLSEFSLQHIALWFILLDYLLIEKGFLSLKLLKQKATQIYNDLQKRRFL